MIKLQTGACPEVHLVTQGRCVRKQQVILGSVNFNYKQMPSQKLGYTKIKLQIYVCSEACKDTQSCCGRKIGCP